MKFFEKVMKLIGYDRCIFCGGWTLETAWIKEKEDDWIIKEACHKVCQPEEF
jgi:hypothetical protein